MSNLLFILFCVFIGSNMAFTAGGIFGYFNNKGNMVKDYFDLFEDGIELWELLLVLLLGLSMILPITLYLICLLLKPVIKLFEKPLESFKKLMKIQVRIPKFRVKIERK